MKRTVDYLLSQKGVRRLSMLTAYDYHTACTMSEADIDMILVGDSLGNVMLGYDNTLAVTVDDMIHHAKAVCREPERPSWWWICRSCRTRHRSTTR